MSNASPQSQSIHPHSSPTIQPAMTSSIPSNAIERQQGSPAVDESGLAKVAVIIPALNEAASLPLVLGDLPPAINVIVVNNGSTDATPDVARENGAIVVDQPIRGYGIACLAGLAKVEQLIANGIDIEVVAFVDADYSDHVHLIDQIVLPVLDDQMDFVLGSRLTGKREAGAMPPQAVWGNRLACFLMNLFFRGSYSDLGPMRAVSCRALERLKMVDTNFGWTIEMQIKALRLGLRIKEIPVPYRRRIGVSKISGTISGTFRAGTKILYSIWLYGFRR